MTKNEDIEVNVEVVEEKSENLDIEYEGEN